MNTSYFAKYKGNNAVSIALSTPNWFKGREYKKLAPTYEILKNYRRTADKVQYVKDYNEKILNKLNPQEIYDELGENAVLLCYEKSHVFCHRHVVSKWLEKNLGIRLTEL
jgi:uncharacterized protein YeaO (DUF488 family)